MKRRLVLFILGVLASLCVLPVLNLRNSDLADYRADPSRLYVMDQVIGLASVVLFQFGISTDPAKVIVGRDGWLHLSDSHRKTLTVTATKASAADHDIAGRISDTLATWNDLLMQRGVKLFRVMIGPNKATIYPENLPDWAQPAPGNASDLLFQGHGGDFRIDLRPALFAAKATADEPIYYPTDSHWNLLGGAAAFRAFAQAVGKEQPDLKWPPESALGKIGEEPRVEGDLLKFLRLSGWIENTEATLGYTKLDIQTVRRDAASGKIKESGGNPQVNFSMTPEIIQSPQALNKRRVLWIRDSFGNALSPLMAATFSDVMAVHWSAGLLPTDELLRLVESFHPDYVFVTVVERDARAEPFVTPPQTFRLGADVVFTPLHQTLARSSNDIAPGKGPGELVVDGVDPYLVFTLPGGFPSEKARFLALAIVCDNAAARTPIRLFWASDRYPGFDEARSITLMVDTVAQPIDIGAVASLRTAGRITNLRLDIEEPSRCRSFQIAFPVFGSVTMPDGTVAP